MSVAHAPAPPQALHDSTGRVFAYFVPAEELERLRGQIERLEGELARMTARRDALARDYLESLEAVRIPEPTEEEWSAMKENSHELTAIITRIEAE